MSEGRKGGMKTCRFGNREKIFLRGFAISSVKAKTIIPGLDGDRTPLIGPLVLGVGVCERLKQLPENILTNKMHEIQTVMFASYLLKAIIRRFS